jgi:hypothetical protein
LIPQCQRTFFFYFSFSTNNLQLLKLFFAICRAGSPKRAEKSVRRKYISVNRRLSTHKVNGSPLILTHFSPARQNRTGAGLK